MRAWGGFWMVLDGKDWLSPVLQALYGAVVEVYVRDL